MGKKKNELNGVLVYRRWCGGAILSTLLLLLVVAVPVVAVIYNWLIITVPDGSTLYTAGPINSVGLDLVRPVLQKDNPFQGLVDAINNGGTTIKYFNLIYKYGLYGMFGLLAIVVLFGVIEAIFFLFYLFTGRVVSPSAPVKLSWVVFVMTGIYAGASFGFSFLIKTAYASAAGDGAAPLVINFWWPVFYTGGAFIAALLLSIVYVVSFKDKFFIGRAKKFGSGEIPGMGGEMTHIITPSGTMSTSNPGGQPQVIVVNSGMGAGQPPIVTIPNGQGINQGVQVQNGGGEQVENPVTPRGVLPADLKSIGGHAFAKNLDLKLADIPYGIKELGVGAFANCLNLEMVSIPKSVKKIKKNCFFNCAKLSRINYLGTKEQWRYVARGSNWLEKAGTRVVNCTDGAIIVDPRR